MTDAAGANLLAADYQAHKDRRENDAEALYVRVLAGPPKDHGQAGRMLGLICLHQGDRLHTLGRGAEAVERYGRALALNPGADVYNNRGVALEAVERLGEAVSPLRSSPRKRGPRLWSRAVGGTSATLGLNRPARTNLGLRFRGDERGEFVSPATLSGRRSGSPSG